MTIRGLFLATLIAMLLTSCRSPGEDIGIGLIHFENVFSTLLEFYDQPTDSGVPVFSANLIYDSARVTIKTSLGKQGTLKFNPLYSFRRQSLVVLQVMERQGDWLRVVTDDVNDVRHWLRVSDAKVESWPDFLKSMYRVRPHNGDENPLRKIPRNGDVLLTNLSTTCFSVLEVQGDWIKVKNESENCSDPVISNFPYAGFLRWKKDGHLLVDFLL